MNKQIRRKDYKPIAVDNIQQFDIIYYDALQPDNLEQPHKNRPFFVKGIVNKDGDKTFDLVPITHTKKNKYALSESIHRRYNILIKKDFPELQDILSERGNDPKLSNFNVGASVYIKSSSLKQSKQHLRLIVSHSEYEDKLNIYPGDIVDTIDGQINKIKEDYINNELPINQLAKLEIVNRINSDLHMEEPLAMQPRQLQPTNNHIINLYSTIRNTYAETDRDTKLENTFASGLEDLGRKMTLHQGKELL